MSACRCQPFRRMASIGLSLQIVAVLISFIFQAQIASALQTRSTEVSAATVASVNYEGQLLADITLVFTGLKQATKNGTYLPRCKYFTLEHA